MFKDKLIATLDTKSMEIWQIAKCIFDHPELGGQEYRAVNILSETLIKYGFEVTTSYLEIPTAFKAIIGSGSPVVYLLAEYDALPGIGHGCGHHLIAGASLGAALVLAENKKLWSGTLVVLGTPAEETEGAKVMLAERGALQGCDAALIFHPGQSAVLNISSQALEALEVVYTGAYGHSAGKINQGNPLVSLINLFQGILDFNKIYYPEEEIQGVIIEGGTTPNLIPQKVVGRFYLRATTARNLKRLIEDFEQMAQRFANKNKTQIQIKQFEPRYLPMKTNVALARLFKEQADYLNVSMDMKKWQIVGSIDMGNVSWEVPSIHPYLPLGSGGIAAHTLNFAQKAGSADGRATMLTAAKLLALTAVEIFARPQVIEEMWAEHGR